MQSLDAKHLGTLPSTTGAIARFAHARLKETGVDVEPLLKKSSLILRQIEDPGARLIRDQIIFLNLAARATGRLLGSLAPVT